ncbi:MAG: hypothetical protein HYR85_18210, partial [Planctomycetes bacterium]|nr:hypothetical protein [Planctomycetota bacterium]
MVTSCRKTVAFVVLLAGSIATRSAFAAGDVNEPAAHEWNQARGNASRSAWIDVAPLRTEPDVAWRMKFPGEMICEPVAWGGVVFIATKKGDARELHALQASTGTEVGHARQLGNGGKVELATWQGTVIVCGRTSIRGFAHQANGFGMGWEKKLAGIGRPCIYGGKIYVVASRCLNVIDARTGNVLSPTTPFDAAGLVTVAPRKTGAAPAVNGVAITTKEHYLGEFATLLRCPLEGLEAGGGKKATPRVSSRDIGQIGGGGSDTPREFTLSPIAGEQPGTVAWLIVSPLGFPSNKRQVLPACLAPDDSLLLLSLEKDSTVVDSCLRSGESAVDALESYLGGSRGNVASDDDRLEVRLHATRDSYLAEKPEVKSDLGWSAGYYAPDEHVSRFYTPSEKETGNDRGRSLYEVVAHELTHHWIDRRWLSPAGGESVKADQPGAWVVEGIATFVEGETIDAAQRRSHFDDETILALDATVQVEAKNQNFPAHELVDLTYEQFVRLSDAPLLQVKPRNHLGVLPMSAIGIFYEESASVSFFMLNRRGDAGRRAFVDYLRAYYGGTTTSPSWKALGFASAEELDAEFKKSIAALRKGSRRRGRARAVE